MPASVCLLFVGHPQPQKPRMNPTPRSRGADRPRLRLHCSLVSLLGCLGALAAAPSASAQRVNLAKYQPATAGSVSSTYLAEFATDGIVSNYHSLRSTNITNFFFPVEITYPRPVTIASAHLYTGLLDSATPTQVLTSYRYQYFDGAAWVTITTVSGNTSTEVATLFPQPVTASRFRLLGISNGNFTVRELAFFPPNLAGGVEQGFPIGTDVTVNLARQRPSLSSSAQLTNSNGPGYAKNAFDGYLDNASRWLTEPVNGVYASGETLEVDLLSTHAVGSAHVYSGIMDANRVSGSPVPDFTLQAWNGTAWAAIPGATITGNTQTARVVTFTSPVATSRVRLLTTSATPARVQELLLFPPRTGGYPLGQDVVNATPPADTWDRYSDSYYRLRNAGPDLRLGLVNGAVVNVAADPANPRRTEWQLLLNYRDFTYRVRNAETGLCLSLAQISKASGTAVVAEDYTALPHQDWRLSYNPANPAQFSLVNAYSGLALQPAGANWAAGTSFEVVTATNSIVQNWTQAVNRIYPKKGLASGFATHPGYSALFAPVSWSYTWARQFTNTFTSLGINHVFNPMQWGDFSGDHGLASPPPAAHLRELQANPKPVHFLGFNEPDGSTQAAMTPDRAIDRWPRLEALNTPLVSPVSAGFSNGWQADFTNQANAFGYRRDYTAVHWYSAPNSTALINALQNYYTSFGRPVWLTEFSNTRWSGGATWTEKQSYDFLAEFLWRAESLPWLRRYSLFLYQEGGSPDSPDPAAAPRSNSLRADGTLTAFGQLYAGWDSVTGVATGRAYHLHNHGQYQRAQNVVSSTTPAFVDPESSAAGQQWFLTAGDTANTFRIRSTADGRALRYWTGFTVAVGTTLTGTANEWRLVADQDGRYFIEHPATNVRLRHNGSGGFSVTTLTDTSDAAKWRFVCPAVAETIPAP